MPKGSTYNPVRHASQCHARIRYVAKKKYKKTKPKIRKPEKRRVHTK